jgi:hypothetical protein
MPCSLCRFGEWEVASSATGGVKAAKSLQALCLSYDATSFVPLLLSSLPVAIVVFDSTEKGSREIEEGARGKTGRPEA